MVVTGATRQIVSGLLASRSMVELYFLAPLWLETPKK